MRSTLLALAVATGFVAIGLAAFAGRANADPYKYCAVYAGGRDGGGTNCGFITLAQCRATISGIGGACTFNPFYDGASFDGDRPARRLHRRHPR